jgi:hypothetical protein
MPASSGAAMLIALAMPVGLPRGKASVSTTPLFVLGAIYFLPRFLGLGLDFVALTLVFFTNG